MDLGHNLNEPVLHLGSDQDLPRKQRWNAVPGTTAASDSMNECFDCNICLDSAHDPVVTLCGHLYCWPCIYKWLQVQSSSLESDEQPKCPVCKAYVTSSTLVPLYGRGMASIESEAKKPQANIKIPNRPQALGLETLLTAVTSRSNQQLPPNPFQPRAQQFHHQQYIPHALGNYTASVAPSSFGGTTMTNLYSPTVWMFGEMVYASFFGSDGNLFAYPYSNSYPPGNSSPRMRRQEMHVEKSLSRVSIFLLCCLILCLLLF